MNYCFFCRHGNDYPIEQTGVGNGLAVKLLCLLKMYPGKPTLIPKGSGSGKSLVQEKVTVTTEADRHAWEQQCSMQQQVKDW